MITDSELRISNESYTHKDFYQIYPEVLELVNSLTNRWDPTATNESDPGVVLLKVLCFIADKLNYNIDKNILENYITSCTQEENMRKLCEMLGYDMHYFNSATTEISFMWTGEELPEIGQPTNNQSILFPAFETVVTSDKEDVVYVLTKPVTLTYRYETKSAPAIEGTLVDFEINSDNIVRSYNLDDNNRLYLPEIHIAENGIFVLDADNQTKEWEKVLNLNTQEAGKEVWKFGYDSKKKLPYIQFPQDAGEVIKNGLVIKYVRTSGSLGNISAKTITKLNNSNTVILYNSIDGSAEDIQIKDPQTDESYLLIQNSYSAINGTDAETIDEAYNGFKKTVGTFDTLTTCRDYANAIYNMIYDAHSGTPLVSNVMVSDIRSDINKASKVATFDSFGVMYKNVSEDIPLELYKKDGAGNFQEFTLHTPKISHDDLYIYPMNAIRTGYNAATFEASFRPSFNSIYEISDNLSDYKTMSHDIKIVDASEQSEDIFCIKNLYKLKASVVTNYRVNASEQKQILDNIRLALFKNFNARKVDFGQELSYDHLLDVMENADTRIKAVNLEEPIVTPYVMLGNGKLSKLAPEDVGADEQESVGSKTYKKLVAKNVLAGRISLFDYDDRINFTLGQLLDESAENPALSGSASNWPNEGDTEEPLPPDYHPTIDASNSITRMSTKFELYLGDAAENNLTMDPNGYTLMENESIQFIAPALKTKVTYPYGVNYYFHSKGSVHPESDTPCQFNTEWDPESADDKTLLEDHVLSWRSYYKTFLFKTLENNKKCSYTLAIRVDDDNLTANLSVRLQVPGSSNELIGTLKTTKEGSDWNWGCADYDREGISIARSGNNLIISISDKYSEIHSSDNPIQLSFNTGNITDDKTVDLINQTTYVRKMELTDIVEEVKAAFNAYYTDEEHGFDRKSIAANMLYKQKSWNPDLSKRPGYLVNDDNIVFTDTIQAEDNYIRNKGKYYKKGDSDVSFLGIDAEIIPAIPANAEYLLADEDVLYINYTDSDDIQHNIKYYKEGNSYYSEETNGVKEEFSGIIKPNFAFYDSDVWKNSGNHFYSVSSSKDYDFGMDDVPGMFAFKADEQLEIRSKVEVKLNTPTKFYWLTNDGDLVFKKISSNPNIFEHLLEVGEYLWYTDSALNSLMTFGSGTRLRITGPNTEEVKWSLNSDDDKHVDPEDVMANGIGAFADTAWITKSLANDNLLTITSMQIVNCGEGDVIKNLKLANVAESSSNWAVMDNLNNFTWNGNKLTNFQIDTSSSTLNEYAWKTRTLLNINTGPDKTETLKDEINKTSGQVLKKLEITTYTSYYTVTLKKSGETTTYVVNYAKAQDKYDKTDIVEHVVFDTPTATFSNCDIRANYLVQQTGGEKIHTSRYKSDKTEVDDLIIYRFTQGAITGRNSKGDQVDIDISKLDNSYSKLDITKYDIITVPTPVPSNSFGLISFYYVPGLEDAESGDELLPVCVSIDELNESGESGSGYYEESGSGYSSAGLKLYNSTDEPCSFLYLKPGLNVVQVLNNHCNRLTLIVDRNDDSNGTLTMTDIKIVKTSETNPSGLNLSGLGLTAAGGDELLRYISDFASTYDAYGTKHDIFYYNIDLEPDMLLDCTSMYIDDINNNQIQISNGAPWFDKNNIANKFVIGQLDVSSMDSGIVIAPGSKLR